MSLKRQSNKRIKKINFILNSKPIPIFEQNKVIVNALLHPLLTRVQKFGWKPFRLKSPLPFATDSEIARFKKTKKEKTNILHLAYHFRLSNVKSVIYKVHMQGHDMKNEEISDIYNDLFRVGRKIATTYFSHVDCQESSFLSLFTRPTLGQK